MPSLGVRNRALLPIKIEVGFVLGRPLIAQPVRRMF